MIVQHRSQGQRPDPEAAGEAGCRLEHLARGLLNISYCHSLFLPVRPVLNPDVQQSFHLHQHTR